MVPKEFVKDIKRTVITDSLNSYKVIFNDTDAEIATNHYWKEALTFFKKFQTFFSYTNNQIIFNRFQLRYCKIDRGGYVGFEVTRIRTFELEICICE